MAKTEETGKTEKREEDPGGGKIMMICFAVLVESKEELTTILMVMKTTHNANYNMNINKRKIFVTSRHGDKKLQNVAEFLMDVTEENSVII